MSDSLRYLDKEGGVVEGDAAQSFLQEKLKDGMKGRYTSEQYDRLMESGGPAVVNSSDGHVNTGPAYPQNNFLLEGEGSGQSSSSGKTGQLSAEEIRDKFGLKFDEEHSKGSGKGGDEKSGAIYHDDTGEYIGTIGGYARNDEGYKTQDGDGHLRLDDGVESLKKIQDYGVENDLTKERSSWNSINDVAGAASDILGQSSDEGNQAEQKPDPIEHSPEMKQAVERVRTYENDIMSGKTSEDVFGSIGNTEADSETSAAFDSSKGMAGIGTAAGAAADNNAFKATSSFLDNKKSEVKKDYNFKPVPVKYGA